MLTTEYIGNKAQELVKKYGSCDPFEICDRLNINVCYKDLGEKIKAFFFYQSRIKTIVLNSRIDEPLQRVLCAHELGHAVLHSDILRVMKSFHETEVFSNSDLTEYEANLFASSLLIRSEELEELLRQRRYSFFQAASVLKLPTEMLDFKMRVMRRGGHDIEPPYLAYGNFLKDI